MTQVYFTQGLVLKKNSVGEADALFTVYTRDYGKIRALAQGVKKEEAKLKGHLEVFNLVNLGFVLGRNGERLTQASLLNAWPNLRASWHKLFAAYKITDLIDRSCLAGEEDLNLWNLLGGAIETLETATVFTNADYNLFLKDFEKKLAATLGYGEKGMKIVEYEHAL